MSLHLYNTLSRSKQAFVPIDPDIIKMYVCGPTVYDRAHIGNARSAVVFDGLYRLLKILYPQVTYVQNITDIDDKIINAALNNQESIANLTARTIEFYHDDMKALNILPPTHEPKATDYVRDMQVMIEQLIDKNHAYVAENHVLFNVKSDPDYGCLSNVTQDDLQDGSRIEVAPYKINAGDFVLWKPSTTSQPGWDSPWGVGRPGWHIECSAMAKKFLGQTFDIHGGGIDLLFPHHENELAQSRGVMESDSPEHPMAKYWIHNGHLMVDGKKMSKSLGNFHTVNDLLQLHAGETIRYTFLGTHYRQPLNWSHDTLTAAKSSLDRLYTALRSEDDIKCLDDKGLPETLNDLLDDFNVPQALYEMHQLTAKIFQETSADAKKILQIQLKTAGNILGILNYTPQEWFHFSPVTPHNNKDKNMLTSEEIDQLIQQRITARLEKDFKKADEIRKQLDHNNIIVEDSPTGSVWKRK